MKQIKVKAPSKINLDLKILGTKCGYHLIKSTMQSVSLCDFITISKSNTLSLSGTKSNLLSWGEENIVYKASLLFFKALNLNPSVNIHVEKNIPISAGLAGGSTDAAATLYGLNLLYDTPFNEAAILSMCEILGSDLNFCVKGGRCMVEGRGEILTPLEFEPFNLTIVKPKNLGISARDAYMAFDNKKGNSNLNNDLEWALLGKYKEIDYLHNLGLSMSGSGSAFFKIGSFDIDIDENKFEVFRNLKALPHGVCKCKD